MSVWRANAPPDNESRWQEADTHPESVWQEINCAYENSVARKVETRRIDTYSNERFLWNTALITSLTLTALDDPVTRAERISFLSPICDFPFLTGTSHVTLYHFTRRWKIKASYGWQKLSYTYSDYNGFDTRVQESVWAPVIAQPSLTLKPRLLFREPYSGVPGFSHVVLLGSVVI